METVTFLKLIQQLDVSKSKVETKNPTSGIVTSREVNRTSSPIFTIKILTSADFYPHTIKWIFVGFLWEPWISCRRAYFS